MENSEEQLEAETKDNEDGKNHRPFTELTARWLFGIGLLALITTPLVFWSSEGFYFKGDIKPDVVGQFGDFIGGFVGSLWALAGVVLFYVALREQRKDFKTNREILRAQLEEFKVQQKALQDANEVYEEQSETARSQRFESSFFSLIELLRESLQSSEHPMVHLDLKGKLVFSRWMDVYNARLKRGENHNQRGTPEEGTRKFIDKLPNTLEEGAEWIASTVKKIFEVESFDFESTINQFYLIAEYVCESDLIDDSSKRFYLRVLHEVAGAAFCKVAYLYHFLDFERSRKVIRNLGVYYGENLMLKEFSEFDDFAYEQSIAYGLGLHVL